MKLRLMMALVLVVGFALVGCRTTADHMAGDEMADDMGDEMAEEDMGDKMAGEVELTVTIEVLSGSPTPLAPVAWAVHDGANPFVADEKDMTGRLQGLEALAEDGDPSGIGSGLDGLDRVASHGVTAVPDGASAAGPATPGASYSFTVTAEAGQHLSFATMYVQSNDLFYSPGENGLALFDMSEPVHGEVTEMVVLYDAGTEMNEEPGAGANQAPRQSGPDTGTDEDNPVRPVSDVNDGYTYPDVSRVIRVTIDPAGMM